MDIDCDYWIQDQYDSFSLSRVKMQTLIECVINAAMIFFLFARVALLWQGIKRTVFIEHMHASASF